MHVTQKGKTALLSKLQPWEKVDFVPEHQLLGLLEITQGEEEGLRAEERGCGAMVSSQTPRLLEVR